MKSSLIEAVIVVHRIAPLVFTQLSDRSTHVVQIARICEVDRACSPVRLSTLTARHAMSQASAYMQLVLPEDQQQAAHR